MKAFFSSSASFAAQISSSDPDAYAEISKSRKDLKTWYFDLANHVKDASLLADSVKSGLNRSIRKLNLR